MSTELAVAGTALIVGCARSGTSIVGELVAAHPDVRYVFEAHAVWEAAGEGEGGSHRLTAAHATSDLRETLRSWARSQRGAARVLVEKNPRNALRVPFLHAVFPEARFIHVLRDGRDVACSLLPGIGGAEWSHLKPPGWRRLLDEEQGILRCALAWREVVEIALADLAATRHLTVRYETLVAEPRRTASEILSFLGLADDPAVDRFTSRIADETRGAYHAATQVMWYRDDHEHRVGRWRELEARGVDFRRVEAALRPLLDRLGYS